MFSTQKLEEWRRLTKTEPILEDGRTVAGQQAEIFLKSLVKNNLKYKGAYCFAGKRVPSKQHKRRFELDLIVLTKKQLHFLEVKNWSGELFSYQDKWVQRKRDGRTTEHPHLTRYNSMKTEVMLDYLSEQGVKISNNFVAQKVIFMNPSLRIYPEILNDPNVIHRLMLDKYLTSQKGASVAERMVHSIIEACLDSEKGQVVMDGLFSSLTTEMVEQAANSLSELRTWDKIGFYGGRTLQGDALKLINGERTFDLSKLKAGELIHFQWSRNKIISLGKTLLSKSLGKTMINSEIINLNSVDSMLLFHSAGEQKPNEIEIRHLNWLSKG